jgi:hypothetical protein
MDNTVALLSIAAAMIAGAMSPGPSFLMIARTSVAVSRADGLAAALGMGAGGVVFALAALAGLRGAVRGGAVDVRDPEGCRRRVPGLPGLPDLARCESAVASRRIGCAPCATAACAIVPARLRDAGQQPEDGDRLRGDLRGRCCRAKSSRGSSWRCR